MSTFRISNFSRYKDTFVFENTDGTLSFGLQRAPIDFVEPTPETGAQVHSVRVSEVGFLDSLAVRYYGNGMERLWWVIAQANAMVDPEREMYPGQRLTIPPRSAVTQFLGRAGDAI